MQSRTCKTCQVPCDRCSGESDSDCLSCKTPKFLFNKTCVETCPPELFGDVSDLTCKNCQPPCEKCLSNSTKCTSCLEIYFLHLESCLQQCPSGYWGISLSKFFFIKLVTSQIQDF